MAQGLGEMTEDFPAPPVPAAELQALLDAYNAAAVSAVGAESALREQHASKDQALTRLVDAMKADIKYAEVTVRDRPERLSKLGWGPRRTGTSLEAPGEVRSMSIRAEGDTWVLFTWKLPVEGGPPAAYTIQRKRDGGPWEDVGTSVDTEALLSNQPRGVEMQYRVVAVNKAGTGQPSATVNVVL